MKKLFFILSAIALLASCEREPDLDKLDYEYLVYTAYDDSVKFADLPTYYIPDQIPVVTDNQDTVFLSNTIAEPIIAAYISGLDSLGYTMATSKESADIGLQISYIRSTYLFTAYSSYPDYWWGGTGYWPWYWGGGWGGGCYHPFPITYTLTTNSFITEMVELTSTTGKTATLPVIWSCYMVAPTGSTTVNTDLVTDAIVRAFEQSTYLNIK
jgi:hypothetical protein